MISSTGFSAPHWAAAAAGLDVLREGGSAIDAMVAAAATIAVVYPHMNSLGGDGFWLIQHPGRQPVAIDACGFAAAAATPDWYAERGFDRIPSRGPEAALTLNGTVDGWRLARSCDLEPGLPLTRLFEPAIHWAENGVVPTASQRAALAKVFDPLADNPDFSALYLPDGAIPDDSAPIANRALGGLLRHLAARGLDDFYRGEAGAAIGDALAARGSPITRDDLGRYAAEWVTPLTCPFVRGQLYNLPAPTQGIASLIILALYDRLADRVRDEADYVHLLVEATKRAFIVRDAEVSDRARLSPRWPGLLEPAHLDRLAGQIDMRKALPWPAPDARGDTVWMGAVDARGTLVSFIQSVYWEFGSGVTLPEFGLVWNNRGTSFELAGPEVKRLAPGLRPFHTLNPALAHLNDGRRIAYGTMGGEGQPQTQAAILTRYLFRDATLPAALAEGRWLLGRTWGADSTDLKLERSLSAAIGPELKARGHDVAELPDASETLGHAGAVVRHGDGRVEAATDPRSDGAAFTAQFAR